IIVCRRISTFSCSATASALRSGRTLNPMITALEVEANSTSDSLMAPTPAWITRTFTFSFESFCSVSVSTSADPPTSVLRTRGSSLTSPANICLCSCSRVRRLDFASAASRAFWSRKLTICLALAVSVTTWKSSPASGIDSRPSTSTGVAGSAFRICRPRSFCMARSLPNTEPQMKKSPTRSVPLRTSTVATGPRPRSSWASITEPMAGRLGLALSSCMSATSRIFSSSRPRPCWVLAETGTMMVSPPQSSASRPRSESCCLMRSGCAPGLSILLIATTIGSPAGRAGSMASSVCGITPSSAATTSTTMSVTLAPRARMRVNASWPGVSMKTILRPSNSRSERLRHHAVVRRHHQHNDVGYLGPARPHAGERLVARRIDEDDLAAVQFHLVSADVLRDAPGFPRRHVGFANDVQQRRLAVIHVTHDGDHRRALLQILGVLGGLHGLHGLHLIADGGGGSAELARHVGGQLGIERLVDGRVNAAIHQLLNEQSGLHVQLLGKLLHGDAFRNGDFAADGRRAGFHVPPGGAKDSFLLHTLPLLSHRTLVARASARLVHGRRGETGFQPAAALRGGVLRPGAAPRPGARRARINSRPGDHWLAGTDGTAIDRLPGNRRGMRLGNSGPRRRGLRRHDRPDRKSTR